MAFKSTKEEEEEESENDGNNDEMALITRKFKRFMKKQWRGDKQNKAKWEPRKEATIICYECKKLGHIKVECPVCSKYKLRVGIDIF